MIERKKYNHKDIEKDLYNFWVTNRFFEPEINSKKKRFSIILPPPNVTGHLHLGHAWDGYIQDLIIRYKKLNGFNCVWVPGTDHAGIATQTKYEKILNEKGVDKSLLSREQFVKQIYDWSSEQSKYIHSQWAKLGLSLSYDNEQFTLNDQSSKNVLEAFVILYNDGLIYRDNKIVNWDCKLQTAISDIEVKYEKTTSKLYYCKYYLCNDKNKYLVVATTRPETIFADTNLFVNPTDRRYKQYVGKFVFNPLTNNKIKIISDKYVDKKFGTGVMKCTPAHDINDYELGIKHKITNYVGVINYDGKLNKYAVSKNKSYEGLDRIKARKLIANELKEHGLLENVETYSNQISISERSGEIIEPLISKEWFVKMTPILKNLKNILKWKEKYMIIPKKFNKLMNNWLKNTHDWCISRNLVWGHQIPIWYEKKTNKIYAGVNPPKDEQNYVREQKVFDTWFSSGLWPITTLLSNDKLKSFFPVDVLVTGYDILFFWVARMLFMCSWIKHKIPIKNILLHGLIRDSQNRKMSKSLNNGIDPMDLIEKYGTDALRLFLTSTVSAGEDLRYDETKIQYFWSFLNKLWNSNNFIQINFPNVLNETIKNVKLPINIWIINEFNKIIKNIKKHYDSYNLQLANKNLINFVWNVFCNEYLEFIKPFINDDQYKEEVATVCLTIFKNILILVHPIAPFITEHIFQNIFKYKSILLFNYPTNIKLIKTKKIDFTPFKELYFLIKDIRIKNNLKQSDVININLLTNKKINLDWLKSLLIKFNINLVSISSCREQNNWRVFKQKDLIIEIDNKIFPQKNKDKILSELKKLEFEIKRSKGILANESFIKKAPKEKVNLEKTKLENYQKQYDELKKELK